MMAQIASGLEGVVFTESKLTFIDGDKGILTHLGIPIQEWAENSTFEELSLALLLARLPKQDELDAFDATLKAHREIPEAVYNSIAQYPTSIHPMHALRTAISMLGMYDQDADSDNLEVRKNIGLRLTAQFPTVIAAIARGQEGKEAIRPRSDLSHAANFLYMLSGSEPSPEKARLFDIALVLHVDHSMNASTFTGIATVSTLSDMYSSVTSALGSLKGPLHGGANEAVMDMLQDIGTLDKTDDYVNGKFDRKEKIMGVGHRVYKFFDPRSRVLRDYAAHVAEKHGKSHDYEILERIEGIAIERLSSKGIYPNVDFYSGVVYSDLGIKKEFFTPVFALARISGWVASILEYVAHNKLLRPTAHYTGASNQHYIPIAER